MCAIARITVVWWMSKVFVTEWFVILSKVVRRVLLMVASEGVYPLKPFGGIMRTTAIVVAMVAISAVAPAVASAAAATCHEQYYKCLNDSWDATGLQRLMADAECGIRYYGCLKAATK